MNGATDFRSVDRLLARAQSEGREALTEPDTKRLLALAGIAVPREAMATSAAHARQLARRIGYPVVLKIVSPDVLHKSDVGGVELGLGSGDAVVAAYERIMRRVRRASRHARVDGVLVQRYLSGTEVVVGGTTDAQLGPVVVFGMGGTAVELLDDVAFRLAPIDARAAREMIGEIKLAPLVRGYRGAAALSKPSIVCALLAISRLMFRFSHVIREIEINPLLVTPRRAVAADALAVLVRR